MDIASSSSSAADNPPRREKYDVFISFRGDDTRLGITSHLHAALLQKKIETYIDNRLQRGEEIRPALLEAIEKSTISVIIFSQNYASSTWCLDELVHILKCNNREGRMVIPVFYDIDPSDVRKQHGSYAYAFAQLEKRFDNSIDKVHKWRDALTTAANLSGFYYSNKSGTEANLIQEVVDHIWAKMCRESSCDLKGFVGIERRIEQIESLLGIHSPDACITVGIWGMGGIGKTTLAEAVFRIHSSKFEASYILKNVREKSEQVGGLDHLEETLLKNILKEEVLPVGSTLVGERLSRTKVLIVQDDVSDPRQMERLVGDRLRYGSGSRIIITSRDRSTLRQTVEEDKIYEVQALQPDDALQLFCLHAFKNNGARRTDFKELVEKAVHYAGRVPLALIVLGSLLFNYTSKEEWEEEFNKLKQFPSESIQKVLRISYDRLEKNEKEIFLDIACFYKGEPVVEVKRRLASCGRFPKTGIDILINRCLISIGSKWGRETIEMHDLLQEMGRKIVQEQDIKDPGKRSRLFNDEDVYRVLKSNTETPNVEAIRVDWSYIEKRALKRVGFKKMSNLITLIVNGGYKLTASLDLPDSLRYLEWTWYQLESLPSNFCPENLVELYMPHSKVKKLWKEEQILVNLQVIDLWGCSNLTEVPNLSRSLKIVEINLARCERLVEIPSYFQHLDKLTRLDLGDCTSLEYLPEMPRSVQYLDLQHTGIKELPESVWSNENISYLNLMQCKDLRKLPSGRWKLKNLNLDLCSNLENFPEILEPMEHLKSLSLIETAVTELPSSICNLTYLESLDLTSCSRFSKFPEILKPMEHLKSLSLIETSVTELPSSICELKYLESLDLTMCNRFSKFPEILKPMEHLVYLNLSWTAVEMLPSSIGILNRLQDLNLSGCDQLKDVPTSIYSLTNLKRLDFWGCRKLKDVPTSICSLTNLKRLDFWGCRRLEKLPSSSFGFLSLEELVLSDSGILEIPASIKQASRLSVLDLCSCDQLQSIPELPVLCNVRAKNCKSLKIVSCSRTTLTQGWDKPNYCFRLFTNCPKLDNNSRSNIMDDAQITIMRMATVAPLKGIYPEPNMKTAVAPFKDDFLPHHHHWPSWFSYQNEGSSVDIELCPDQINIACPGKEIPNWFSYQNEGSSVNIELCPDWFRGLFGFALSVVLSKPSFEVRANFIVKFLGESHELFSSKYIFPDRIYHHGDGQHHVHVWNEAFRSEEVGKNCSPDVYKLAKEASVVFCLVDCTGRPPLPHYDMKVESCGICPLYSEDAEKFKLGHVFMSRGPKVEEETKQDEPQASGSCDESEANESDDHGSEVSGTEDDSSDESEANESD
ncbi:unnamed protein product [Malus baccata var. baccata]